MLLDTNKRTRQEMDDRGWVYDKCEKYVMQSGQYQDLFGLFDYVAMCPKEKLTIGIQSTVRSEISRHRAKWFEPDRLQRLRLWLECGNAAVLWCWYRADGKKINGRHNTFKRPPGDWHPNKTVFLWEEELTLRQLDLIGPDVILDAGSV